MELDPSKWLVSFAGFVYDLLITREWQKLFVAFSPLALLLGLTVAVWGGGQLNKGKLAAWYWELGNNLMAPQASETSDNEAAQGVQDEADQDAPPADANANPIDLDITQTEIPRTAEIMFRRVQLLEPSDNSLCMIGAALAQRQQFDLAIKLLTQIAPNDEVGLRKAHAYLAFIYQNNFFSKYQSGQPAQQLVPLAELAMHHSKLAAEWPGVPASVLVRSSELALFLRDTKTSLQMLDAAARRDQTLLPNLIERSMLLGNEVIARNATRDAIEYAERRLQDNPKDVDARLMLASTYVRNNMLEEAEETLKAVDYAKDQRLLRALSDVYCFKFIADLKRNTGPEGTSANMSLLEVAMRFDPTNPRTVEQIARMADSGAARPNDEMMQKLQQFLAEGKASTTTHLLISRIYLKRGNFEKAIPHMEQVAVLEPRQDDNLNNLAYVYAFNRPEKLETALKLVQSALALSSSPNAGYIDTLGVVLMKLGRTNEAIAAFQKAIQVDPNRIDVQQNIREAYLANGQPEMAEVHAKRIEFLEEQKALAKKQADEQAARATNNPAAESTADDERTENDEPMTDTEPVQDQTENASATESGAKLDEPSNAPPTPAAPSEKLTSPVE